MSAKAWYIIGAALIVLFLATGGWLWLLLGVAALAMGYRASKRRPQPPPAYRQPLPQQAPYPYPAYPQPQAPQAPPQAYRQPARPPQVTVNYPPPAPAPPPQPVQARPVRPPYPMVCPNCGLPLSGYQPVCPRCGYRLNPVP